MVALSKAQLISGSAKPFLEGVTEDRSYVPATWLGSIRIFLSTCKGKVVIQNAWTPQPQRTHDHLLMDDFSTAKPGSATLANLNA
eukprot:13727562-Ditylum_brightwellii.AAC.1